MSTPVHQSADGRVFAAFGEGAEVSLLRMHDGGGVSTLTRFFAGGRGAWHSHPGGEELYVVSGRLRIGDIDLRAGDYLYTPPGAGHDVVAYEDSLLFMVLPQAPDYSVSR